MNTTTNTSTAATTMTAIIGNSKGIKVKLSGNGEGVVELTQNTLCACRLSIGRVSSISGTAEGVNLNLLGHFEGMLN